jgi:hypothetical protein
LSEKEFKVEVKINALVLLFDMGKALENSSSIASQNV